MYRAAVAILLLLAAGAHTGPASSPDLTFQCSATCEGGRDKFLYEVGSTYSYEYRTDSATSLGGLGDDPDQNEEARLHVSATADITVLSPCEFSLQVRDAMLEESVPRDSLQRTPVSRHHDFSAGVSAHSLRFSYQDGRVAHICASGRDPVWVVNFKRGLLSAFQTSMKQLRGRQELSETDVAGTCPTHYHVARTNGSTVVLMKSKNMRGCSRRVQHFLSLPSTSYSTPAKSLPLIRSEQNCEHTVKAGVLATSYCEETHLFRPFSNGGNGASTRVSQTLILSDVSQRMDPEPSVERPVRASLLFHHHTETGAVDVQEAVDMLQKLGRLTEDGVQSDAPGTFAHLVQMLRAMDHTSLAQIYHLADHSSTRKLFLDAMPLVSTAESMSLMVDLLSSKEISEDEGDSWLQSLTFQTRPTVDMLEALMPLVAGQTRAAPLLAVTSLVHRYCAANTDCQDVSPVRTVSRRLEQLLGHDCSDATHQQQQLILLALKAVGNMGVLPGSSDILTRCYQTNNTVEVRLAAISAHRRLACDEASTSRLLYTYSDTGEDTEVRIAAYLGAMRCPSERTLERVRETLYSEDVSQVASFVWTHLTNLQETSNPSKYSIKELLANDVLNNKFSTDARKFSRNYEVSAFSEALNLGGTVESNVVFSPGSYLPRSASINLTVDLFGEAVNVIELGGRAEGFENYVESIFAQDGLLPEKSLRNLLQKLRKDSKKAPQEFDNYIDNDNNDWHAQRRIPKPPTASLYTRIFGNELKYSNFNGIDDIVNGIGKVTDTKDLLSKLLKNTPIDYSKSTVFLDASYVIPTLAGFPLQFTVNGTTTVGLKVSGHVDLDGMWTKGDVDIKGQVLPSLAVEFYGMMSVDAFASKVGILSVSRLHSNTLVNGKLKVQGRKLVELKVNVPRDKMEILDVSSQLLLVRGNQDDRKMQEIRGVQKDKLERKWCTPSSISTLTGMKVCTEMSYPNATRVPFSPYFPLTGPVVFRTWLEKTDSFNSYDLFYHSSNTPDENIYQFSADTLGSKVNRRLKFLYILNTKDMVANLNVIVPGFKLEASGNLENTANNKGFDLSVALNDNRIVETTGMIQISQTDKLTRYEPSFIMKVMNRKLLEIAGRVHHIYGAKYSADIVATGISSEPILISGDMSLDGEGVGFEAMLNSSLLSGSLHTDLRRARNGIGVKAGLSYIFPNSVEQSVSFSAKAVTTNDGPSRTRSASITFHSSRRPEYDLDTSVDWQTNDSDSALSAKFLFKDLDWRAQYTHTFRRHPSHTETIKTLSVTCPEVTTGASMEFQFLDGDKEQLVRAHATLESDWTMTGLWRLARPRPEDLDSSLEVSLPWVSGSARTTLTHGGAGQLAASLSAQLTDVRGTTSSLGLRANLLHRGGSDTANLLLQLQGGDLLALHVTAGLVSTGSRVDYWAELSTTGRTYRANLTYTNHRSHKLTATVRPGHDKEYSGSLEWLLEPEDMEVVLEVQLDRTFSFASEVLNTEEEKGMEVVVFWDKDRDPSKTASFLISTTKENVQAAFVIQKQYASAEINFTKNGMEGQLQWTGGNKVQGRLLTNKGSDLYHVEASLTTPFTGFRTQSAFFNYEQQGDQINISGEGSWQDKSVEFSVDTTFNGSCTDSIKIEVDAKFATSFAALPTAAARFSHISSHNEETSMETKLSFGFNEQYTNFTSGWNISDSKIEGSVVLQSPWNHMHLVLAKIKLITSDIFSLVFVDLQWNSDFGATIDFSYNTSLNTHVILKTSNLLNKYGDLSAELLLAANDSLFMLAAHTHILPFSASLEINNDYKTSFKMSGMLSSPAIRKWEFDLVSEFHQDGKVTKVLDIRKDETSVIWFNGYGKYVSLHQNIELYFIATLPQNAFAGSFINNFESSHSKSSVLATWNGKKLEANIDGTFVNSASKVLTKYNAVLSSTYLKRVWNMELSSESEPGKYTTSLVVPGITSMSYHFNSESTLSWEISMQINSSRINSNVVQRLTFSPNRSFIIEFIAECNGKKVVADYHYAIETEKQSLRSSLITPWTSPVQLELYLEQFSPVFKLSSMLEYGTGKKVNLEGSVQLEVTRGLVQLQFVSPFIAPILLNISHNMEDKVALAIMQWGEVQIEAGAVLYMLGTVYSCKLHALTPFRSWENVTLVGNYDESKSGTKIILSMRRNSDLFTLSGLVSMTSQAFHLFAKLTSPSIKFKSLSVDCRSDMNNFDLVYEHNGKTIEITGKHQLDKLNGSTEVRIKSQSSQIEDLGLRLWYDLEQISLGFVAHQNSKQIQAVINSDKRRTDIQITSPLKIIEKCSISVRHEYIPDQKCRVNVMLNYNSYTLQAAGYVSKQDNDSITASLEIRSNFKGFEKLRVDYSFAGLFVNQKKTSITLSKNNQRYDFAATLNIIDGKQVGLIFKIDTPYVGYESVVGGFNYNITRNQEESDLARVEGKLGIFFELTDIKKEIVVNFIVNSIAVSANVSSSFEGFESASFYGSFELAVGKFATDFQATWNKYLLSGNLSSVLGFSQSDTQLHVVTSFQDFQDICFRFGHDLLGEEKKAYTNIQLNEKTFTELNISGFTNREYGHIAINAHTSLTFMRTMSLNGNYSFLPDLSKECSLTLNTDSYSLRIHATNNKHQTTVELEIPSHNIQNVILTLKHQFQLPAHISLTLERGRSRTLFDTSLSMTESNAVLKLMSPFKPFKHFDIVLNFKRIAVQEPGYLLSLAVLENSENILATNLKLILDWTRRIGINITKQTPNSKQICLSVWSTPEFPPSHFQLVATKGRTTLVSLEGSMNDVRDAGFTFHTKLYTPNMTRDMVVQYYPKDILIQFTSDMGILFDKAIYIQGALNYDKKGQSLSILSKIVTDGNEKNINLSCNYNQQEIFVELRTFIIGFEKIAVEGAWNIEINHSKKFTFSVYKNDQGMDVDLIYIFHVDYSNIHISAQAPLFFSEKLSLGFQYDFQDANKTAAFKLLAGSQLFTICGSLTRGYFSSGMNVQINTPLEYFKKASFEFNYDFSMKSTKKIKFTSDINSAKFVEVMLGVDDNAAVGSAVLYINGAEEVMVKSNYNFSKDVEYYITESSVVVSSQLFSVSAHLKKDLTHAEIIANIWEKEHKLQWKYENTPSIKNLSMQLTMNNNTMYGFIVMFKRHETSEVDATVNLHLPYSQSYMAHTSWNIYHAASPSCNITIKWPGDQYVAFDSHLAFGSIDDPIVFTFIGSSSLKTYGKLHYETKITISDSLILESALGVNRQKVFSLNLHVMYSHLKSYIMCTLESSHGSKLYGRIGYDFTHEKKIISGELEMGTLRILMLNSANIMTDINFEANLEITAPKTKLSKLHFHSVLNVSEFQKDARLIFECGENLWKLSYNQQHQQKFSIFVHTPVTDFEDFKLAASLSTSPHQPANLEIFIGKLLSVTAMCMKSWNAIRFNVSGKLEDYEPIGFEAVLTTEDKFHSLLTFTFNKKQIVLNFYADFKNQKNVVVFESVFKCPWMEDISVVGHFSNGEKESQITVKKGTKVTIAKGNLKYLTTYNGYIIVMSLFFDDLTTAITAEIETGEHISLHLTSKLDPYTFDVAITQTVENIAGHVFLHTPHAFLKEAEGSMEMFLGTMEEPHAHLVLSLRVDDKSYMLSTNTIYSTNSVSGNFTLLTPDLKLENNKLMVTFEDDELECECQFEDVKVATRLSHRMSWPVYSVNLTLDLPYYDINSVGFSSYLHAQNLLLFVSGETESNEIFSLATQMIPTDFNLKIQTQMDVIPDINIASKYKKDRVVVHTLHSTFKWKNEKMSLETTSQIHSSNSAVRSLVTWGDDKKLDLSVSYLTTGENVTETIETIFLLSTPNDEYSSKLEIDLRVPNVISANMFASTPFKNIPDLKVATIFQRSSNFLLGYISITSKNKTFSVRVDVTNPNVEIIGLKTEVYVPIKDIPPIELTIRIQQRQWKDLSAYAQVNCFSMEGHANITYKLQDSHLDGIITVETPFYAKEIIFGGSVQCSGFENACLIGYFNTNKVKLSFSTDNNKEKSLELQLHIPFLDLQDYRFTASIAYGSRKHILVMYKTDEHEGNATLVLDVNPRNISLEGYLNLPILFSSQHLAGLNIEFAGRSHFVKLRYEHGELIDVMTLMLSSDKDLKFSANIESRLFGEKEVTFEISKNFEKMIINFWKAFQVTIKRDHMSGSINMDVFGQKQSLLYVIQVDDNFSGSMYIESPYIKNEKLSISATSEGYYGSSITDVNIQSGDQQCKTTVKFISTGSTYDIAATVTYNDKPIFISNIRLESTQNHFLADATLEVFGMTHKASLRHNKLLLYDTEFRVASPYLPEEMIRGLLTVQNMSITACIGFGNTRVLPMLAMEASIDDHNNSAFLKIESKMLMIFQLLSIRGEFQISDWKNIAINYDGHLVSEMFPTAESSGSLTLNQKFFEASFYAKSSVIGSAQLSCDIYIPFSITSDFNLNMLVTLPNELKYGFGLSARFLSDKLELGVTAHFRTDTAGLHFATVYGSQGKLEFEVNIPVLPLSHFRIDLMGYRTLSDGADTYNFVEWNENLIELKHAVLLGVNKSVLHLGLVTPFENHSNYDVMIHYDNRQSKVVSILFTLPKLGENIGINLDLMFHNLLNFSFLGEVNLPISDKFETVYVSIRNNVEGSNINSSLVARYNEEELEASLTSCFTKKQVKLDANSRINEEKLSLQMEAGQENKKRLAFLEFITPFEILNLLWVNITTASNPADGASVNIVYNSEQILEMVLEKNKSVQAMWIKTPWRLVSGSIFYKFEEEFIINGDLFWNVDKREASLIELKLNMRPHSENQYEVSTMLKIPTRTVHLDYAYQVNTNRVECMMNFSWEEGNSVGYHMLFEVQNNGNSQQSVYLLRGELPSQSIEIKGLSSFEVSGNMHLSAEVYWDAIFDRTKMMQISVGATSQQTEISFHHPGLPSNFILRILKNERLRIEIEYSPVKEEVFVIETFADLRSLNSNGNAHINAMFLVQHNASQLNLYVNTETLITTNEISAALAIQYKNSHRREMQVLNLAGVVKYEVPLAEVHITTTENKISAVLSTLTGLDGSHGLRLNTNINKKQPICVEVKINTIHPLLELELHLGENSSYYVYMGLPNRRQVVVGARHSLDGVQTVDGLIMISLNSSRLLWTRVQWRSESLKELGAFLSREYGDISAIASSVAQCFSDFFEEDFAGKFTVLYSHVQEAYDVVKQYIACEFEETYESVREAWNTLTAMYQRDDFYLMSTVTFLRDKIIFLRENIQLIDDLLSGADFLWKKIIMDPLRLVMETVSSFPATLQAVIGEIKTVAASLLQRTLQLAKEAYSGWQPRAVLREALETTRRSLLTTEKVLQEALSSLDTFVTTAIDGFSHLSEPYVVVMEEVSSYVSDSMDLLYKQLQELLDLVVDAVISEQELEELAELYEKYASWLEELHLQERAVYLQQLAAESSTAVLAALDDTVAAYKQELTSTLNHAFLNISALANIPEVNYLKDIATFVAYKIQWAWQYYEAGDQLKAGLHNAVANIDELLSDLVYVLGGLDTVEEAWSAGSLLVRPGMVQFEQQLPFDWPGFDEPPHFQQLALRPLSRSQRLIEEPAASVAPTLRSSTGLLVGGRHFVTFDGKFFDFVGNCSYVLAADLEDSQYSVFITYHGKEGSQVKKTLTVVVDEQRIQLSEDGQVRVGGSKTDLPVSVGTSALLWRRGDSVVVDALRHGLRLRCNLRHDACSLQVGDRHRGKVSGLLGAFSGDVSAHVSRWRLGLDTSTGDRCEHGDAEEWRGPTEDPQLVEACDELFISLESPLRPCYGVLDPSPFYVMCLVDGREGPCLSSTVYLVQCRAAGVHVDLPSRCVSCTLQDGSTLPADESRLLDPERPESADVVLVVERTGCLAQVSLRDLSEKLYAGMALRGLQEVHYALVSFGPGQPPESHTAQGRLWFSHRSVRDLLRKMTFYNNTGEQGSNALEALQYATRLGFHEGASRSVVLVQCGTCRGEVGYGELVAQLVSQRATLHVLEPDTVRLLHNTSKASKVYGLDARGAYTARNVKTLKPSPTLRRQVKLPKDQCTPAALETGGTLFNLAHLFQDQQDRSYKKFLDVWARRVTGTTLPATCQRCRCLLGPDGIGQTFCDDCPTDTSDSGMLQILQSSP